MKARFLTLTTAATFLLSPAIWAEDGLDPQPETKKPSVYKMVDEQGRTVFTDRPSSNKKKSASPVSLHETNTVPPVTPQAKRKKKTDDEYEEEGYESLILENPGSDDDSEWDHTLSVEVEPELSSGDKFQVLLDGEETDITSTETSFDAPFLEPGAHMLQVQIIDSDGEVEIKSNPILISDDQNSTAGGAYQRYQQRTAPRPQPKGK